MTTPNNENELTTATTATDAKATKKSTRIEAYGTKGWKNAAWRKTFPSSEKLMAWCEKHDATVLGTRRDPE